QLFIHFDEHKQEMANLSFFEFISLHYSSGQQEDKKEEHKQLPFKSHECHHAQILILDIPIQTESLSFTSFETNFLPAEQNIYLSETIGSIWQPPQA
ncbi:MAG TPA: hypothetical protein VGF79_08340, partial [Bacteroidia bacterium]